MSPLGPALVALVVAATALAARRALVRARAVARLYDGPDAGPDGGGAPAPPAAFDPDAAGALARWLALAGFRRPAAPTTFVAATGGGALLGGLFAWALGASGLVAAGARGLEGIPGGLGLALTPVLAATGPVVALLLAAAPALVVRAARRARVREAERDLPLTLELLATLGEAGLGFDAALERLLAAQPADRPLALELRTYQREVLAGVPRAQALRRVARRLDVTPVTVLVSGLVQAEQVGASLAEALRRQADDLRNRRRERALVLAEALPVKLVFPLVICFLPGLFVTTLGPAFHQLFQLIDARVRQAR